MRRSLFKFVLLFCFSGFFFLSFIPCILNPAYAARETLTIETYYPAPYGSFFEVSSIGTNTFSTEAGKKTTIGASGQDEDKLIVHGNVGIGVADPTGALDISRGSNTLLRIIDNSGTTRVTRVQFATGPAQSDNMWQIGTDYNALNVGDFMINKQGAASPAFYIDTSNAVGIGTASPNYALEVKSSGATGNVALFKGNPWESAGNTSTIYLGDTNHYLQAKWGGPFTIDSTDNIVIQPTSGNVGIGTTSPDTNLDVVGVISVVGGGSGIEGGQINLANATQVNGAEANSWTIDNYNNGTLRFFYNSNNPVTMFKISGTNGDVTASGSITAGDFFYGSSDLSLKTSIQPLSTSLSLQKILQLNGISFAFKKSGREGLGFAAQEVEKVFPQLVNTNKETGLKSLNYTGLIAPLIEAVKEQEKKIESLESEIASQKLAMTQQQNAMTQQQEEIDLLLTAQEN